jgi:hypothetical protein
MQNYKVCINCNTNYINLDKRSKYCTPKCKNNFNARKAKKNMQSTLRPYISEKIRKLNKDLTVEEVIENVPGIKSRTCTYCNLEELSFRSDDGCEPCKLSIDAMYPEHGHVLDNLVGCCWMCNRMKHTMDYVEWMELINFLKGTTDILDCSNKSYVSIDDSVSELHRFKPWNTLNVENKELFEEKNSSKSYFLELYNSQNRKDSLFNLFPLVLFDRNNKLNVSCDKIDCNDNTKYQLLPFFLNLAKSTLSNQELLEEFKKRSFLLNLENKQIILPENYNKNSIFINKLILNKRVGKGHNGMKRSDQVKKNISESKKGKNMGANSSRSRKIVCIDTNNIRTIYMGISEAARMLNLPVRAPSNISNCALGRAETAYGYKWKFLIET